jgi:hypothetical protein
VDKRLAFERRIRVISAVFGIISISSVSGLLTIWMNDLQNTLMTYYTSCHVCWTYEKRNENPA